MTTAYTGVNAGWTLVELVNPFPSCPSLYCIYLYHYWPYGIEYTIYVW